MARSDRTSARSWRLLGVLGATSLVASMLACNAIIGLDSFQKSSCGRDCAAGTDGGGDGAPLPDDADLRDAPDDVVDSLDAADAAPVPIPDGASPTSWAQKPMPNPEGGANPFSYTRNADNSVTDNVTSLVWLPAGKSESPQGDGFQRARTDCANLGDAGTAGTGWRLPTRIELVTLIDPSHTGKAVDSTFDVLSPGWYWTSSVVRPPTLPYRFWSVNFGTGEVSPDASMMEARQVICVKGSP